MEEHYYEKKTSHAREDQLECRLKNDHRSNNYKFLDRGGLCKVNLRSSNQLRFFVSNMNECSSLKLRIYYLYCKKKTHCRLNYEYKTVRSTDNRLDFHIKTNRIYYPIL